MAKRIRSGYYTHKNHEIERMDEAAEVYPGDEYYGEWRVYDLTGDVWLHHFATKREAVEAINGVSAKLINIIR